MSGFVAIPEVYIKEEPVDKDFEHCSESNEDPISTSREENPLVSSKPNVKQEHHEETMQKVSSESPNSNCTDDINEPTVNINYNCTAVIDEDTVNINYNCTAVLDEPSVNSNLSDDSFSNESQENFNTNEENFNSLQNKMPVFQSSDNVHIQKDVFQSSDNVHIQEDLLCQNKEDTNDESDTKGSISPELIEKRYRCPICQKCFRTSSAMNGHVAKGHRTTLGLKFTCHVCGAAGSSRASLKRHLIRTHKITNVDHPELLTKKCVHCGIGFSSHLLLYQHIRSEHSDILNIYHHCNWCPALMRAKASLIRHVRRAHPGKEQPFLSSETCSICNKQFSNRPMLQRHMNREHPDIPRHICPICNAAFKFPYMLSRHKVSHEDPEKYQECRKKRKYSVVCDYCGRKFGSKPRLEYHIRMIHTNPQIKIYTCRLCGLTFPTAKLNNRHYRKVHRPERQKIHCGKCNITFKTPEECSQHRALHPNTCDVCQKQFLRRDSLREHLLIHSAPRHQCPHCTKMFTQRSNLKRHIRVHTGEKPYQCPFCHRCFSDKSACNSHIRVHTGYERSVCAICGASFSKKQRLNYHMRIHTGEGLLYCPLCTRPSTNSYSLRKHIESHQQPLTKALTSLGFKPLLVADPNLVMGILHALTQATLQNNSSFDDNLSKFRKLENDKHAGIFNCKNQSLSPLNSKPINPLKAEVLKLLGTETVNPISVEPVDSFHSETQDLLQSEIVEKNDNKEEIEIVPRHQNSKNSVKEEEPVINRYLIEGNVGDKDSPFNLTKFLQSLLEKESMKVRIDRKSRIENSQLPVEDASTSGSHEQNWYETDLPPTIGDELVKQCLEIIMKDEPQSCDEDDDDDVSYDSDYNPAKDYDISVDSVSRIKIEEENSLSSPHSEIVSDTDSESEKYFTANAFQGIPKIKISRITDSQSSEEIFVAEIIKKKLTK